MKKFLLVVLITLAFSSYTQATDYLITSYGAKADGKTNNAPFIQKAIDEASANSGGKVIIPPGNFASGVLVMKSGVNLHLELGACLLGSVSRADYDNPIATAFLVAKDQKNISITGEGVIDGQAGELMLDVFRMLHAGTLIDKGGWSVRPSEGIRPMLILFKNCDQVKISGVTMKDAASWVQDYNQCNNLTIDGIKVQSTSYWNNDGIDISDCKDVKVINCFVNAADDGICLKSETVGKCCDNVYIANCTIRSSASAFKMGTASYGGFKNIKVEHLTIFDTFRSAIAIESVDGGQIENVTIQHIKAINTGNAIFIRLGHRNKKADAGSINGIYISNVKAEIPLHKPDQGYPLEGPPDINSPDKEKMPARRSGYPYFGHPWLPFNLLPSSIVGIPGHSIQNVTLENIEITYAGEASKSIANIGPDAITTVPECEPDYPEFSMFGELPAWGFYVRHTRDVTMKNIMIKYLKNDFRPAIVFDDAAGVVMENIVIPTTNEIPVLLLNNVSGENLKKIKMSVGQDNAILRSNN